VSAAARDPDLAPAGLEAWLAGHRWAVTWLLVLAAVLVRVALCLQLAGGPLLRLHEVTPEADNHFFHTWGARVAAGDLLQRSPVHPMTSWMAWTAAQAIAEDPALPVRLGLAPDAGYDREAMRDRLWDHWLGGATFFQEPAYPYLVGLTYALGGPAPWHVFAWQLVLGVLGVLLVRTLGRGLFSETAGATAGGLAVLAPVPLIYDVALLRDGLVTFLTLALAVAMHATVKRGGRRWLLLGVLFGAAALVKQSFLAFPVALVAWRLLAARTPLRPRLVAAGLCAAGMALALLPAIARNLAVGVPALAMNGSAAAMLSIHHIAEATPFDLTLGPSYVRALVTSDGRLAAALLEAARSHPTFASLANLELGKLLYAFHGYEPPNDVDLYLFRQAAPVLGLLPVGFALLLPLAGLGLASRPAAGSAWPLLIAALASLPTLLLATVLSRYRAPLAAALLPLSGAGAVRLAAWIRARRWQRTGIAAAATAAYLAFALSDPPGKGPRDRARPYAITGVGMLETEPAYAALNLREALRLVPDSAKLRAGLREAEARERGAATVPAARAVPAASRPPAAQTPEAKP
jgi:4-amino-4-deoxy-L-arabinose transferase-like glycosyltransferase